MNAITEPTTLIDGRWRFVIGDIGLDDVGVWRRIDTGEAECIWLRFLSGRRMNILAPSPLDFEWSDAAVGGSREARWGGHTIGEFAYVVGQHSVEGLRLMRRRVLPQILTPQIELRFALHDVSEMLGLKDQLAPSKRLIGPAWHYVDARVQGCVHRKAGLSERTPRPEEILVKRFDQIMAATEAVQLAGYSREDVGKPRRLGGLGLKVEPDDQLHLTPWSPAKVRDEFLGEIEELVTRCARGR